MGVRLSRTRAELVERCGMVLESEGLPRMAGRVLGYLLVADPPAQPVAEIRAALAASSGSVSTMTRLLIQAGYVDRVRRPGERRDYFAVRAQGWTAVLTSSIESIRAMRRLMDDAATVAPTASIRRLAEGRRLMA